MAPSLLATMNGVPILLLSVVVPLRILQLALRFFNSQRGGYRTPTRSLFVLAFASALVVSVYAFSDPAAASAGRGAEAVQKVEELRREMATEIRSLKDRIFELESALEESAKKLDAKTGVLEENTKLIEAMERDIQHLIDEQETIKTSLSSRYDHDDSKDLEQEVELLKDQSQKVNSDIYNLEVSSKVTEERLETLNSETEKIQNIVSEQWIQIRHLEQAFQQTKIMASRVRTRTKQDVSLSKQIYLKVVQFIEVIRLQLIHDISVLESFFMGPFGSFLSDTYEHLLRFGGIAQKHFHEVLRSIRKIHLKYASDENMPDSFFMGCSVSRRCLAHLYKFFRTIRSAANKCHYEVTKLVNRII